MFFFPQMPMCVCLRHKLDTGEVTKPVARVEQQTGMSVSIKDILYTCKLFHVCHVSGGRLHGLR